MASTLATISSNKIDQRFSALRSADRKALVCYTTAGFPDYRSSLDLIKGLEEAGADVVEIGVPFSDPIADGPVIQESSQRALASGMTLERTLELVAEAGLGIPVVLFTYLNPLLAHGDRVLERAAEAGIDGILVTDLPVGADDKLERWLGSSELDYIRLVAPTTPALRMSEIVLNGSGFVYLISRLGVTGPQLNVSADLPGTIARLRGVTDLPVCVGFGISNGAQAREVAMLADGVVVGSALVREASSGVTHAIAFAKSLRTALDS